ncbi:MAG: MarR family transcriptional regulator [Methanobacteriota archaeon]
MTRAISLPLDLPLAVFISIIFRTRVIILNHRLRSLGLSAGQFPVLMYLLQRQGITQETLVKTFHIDRGTIARAVRKLEDMGYITRSVDPENRRAFHLFLSKKGEDITPAVIEIDHEWERIATSSLTDVEMELFRKLLNKIALTSLQGVRDIGDSHYADCLTIEGGL